jgi:hypothetical protein
MKKFVHPSWVASHPLPEDSKVRPTAMKDVSSAYWVAV